jgi:hypothetical protein
VSASGGQPAACWLAGSTMWPRFARAGEQQGSWPAVDGRFGLLMPSRLPGRRLGRPTTSGRDPSPAPSLQQEISSPGSSGGSWRLAMNAGGFCHTKGPL